MLIRFLILLLSVTTAWLASPGATLAENNSARVKTREGSLVLEGQKTGVSEDADRDVLHTMLSREVKVYIFRGSTRIWPRSQGYYPKLAGPNLERLIHKYASHYGVDPSLVRAVMRHESGFNPQAVSPKGAQGLMQLMPGTAAQMGVQNPFDPEQNIAGGVGYLRLCLDRFGHSVPLAVAAYNAGPERVAQSQGIPSIPETQNFVKNVLGTYTGKTPASLAAAKPDPGPPDKPRAKTITRPSSQKILPVSLRKAAPEDEVEVTHRPRAKVIEVRYPKRVAAKPQGAD